MFSQRQIIANEQCSKLYNEPVFQGESVLIKVIIIMIVIIIIIMIVIIIIIIIIIKMCNAHISTLLVVQGAVPTINKPKEKTDTTKLVL